MSQSPQDRPNEATTANVAATVYGGLREMLEIAEQEAAKGGKRRAFWLAEVAKVRSEMRSKCWNTVDRGGISEAKLGFSLSFDSGGKVVASAVQQQRDSYITGLDTCLAPFAHAIAVPAPGEPVSVEVELELP